MDKTTVQNKKSSPAFALGGNYQDVIRNLWLLLLEGNESKVLSKEVAV